ncbi:MAG: transcription termination/antitermination protein NusA [Ruminococcaceae bacterium]|nr:transcription termination/antitermination protein NusA [Oscillospiraceae bacterium]
MNTEFFNALDALEQERGISKAHMITKIETALKNAYEKEKNGLENVKVVIDESKKEIKVYQTKRVVEFVEKFEEEISLEDARKIKSRYALDDIVDVELKTKDFRRSAARAAKSVIIQGIREAEREMTIKEYTNKREEVVTATVLKVDPVNGNVVVDTGTSQTVLLKSEQIPGEKFEPGDRIKVFIMEVKNENKGPIVTLSRTHFGLVKRLFELEIPEIQDATVVIKGISREAGSRTKISVKSRDENVDPVGACIGKSGGRIASIINELGGEKIDIIKYSDSPEEYVSAALSPATVKSVTVTGEHSCRVIVDNDQLSLAIGKEGQNARLAARLTGYKIDIKTESQIEKLAEE